MYLTASELNFKIIRIIYFKLFLNKVEVKMKKWIVLLLKKGNDLVYLEYVSLIMAS